MNQQGQNINQEQKQQEPSIQIFYDFYESQYENNFYDSIFFILKHQYKSIEDLGCRMHWQGLDKEIETFKGGDYIKKNGGKFYLVYDNSENFKSLENQTEQQRQNESQQLAELFFYNKNESNLDLCLIQCQEYEKNPQNYNVDISQYVLVSMQKLDKQLQQERIVGCIALRQLPKYENKIFQKQQEEKGIIVDRKQQGEIKRMFIQPNYRKQGFPKLINEILIRDALFSFGYKELYLDTLHRIKGVQNLYKNIFGYQFIDQYNENPEEDAVYMYKSYF